jgi:hypothetical protein
VSYGLAPRPELSSEEAAAVVAAVKEVMLAQVVVPVDRAPAWRFSGRWFSAGPYVERRPVRAT